MATLRTPSALDDLKQEYDENQLLLLPLDVTNIGQIRSAFQAATDKYGRIDFVYNLAGHGLIGEVEGTPEEVARAMFEVNFWGATRISNEAVRVFREVNEPRGGHLFVITSLVGLKAMAGTGFYAATKHGQARLCQYQVPLVDHPYSVGRCYRGPKYGTPPILGYQGMVSDIRLVTLRLSFGTDHNNRAGEFPNQGHQGKPQGPDTSPSLLGRLPRIQTAAGFPPGDHHGQRSPEALRNCVLPSLTRPEPSLEASPRRGRGRTR